MELTPQERRRVWWGGAIGSALKGIPQGIMLGVLGYALLLGAVYALAALFPPVGLGLAGSFGTFLFANGALTTAAVGGITTVTALPALTWAAINPLPVIALNAVLTVVGNFLTGGKIAVGDYVQKIDHQANVERIRQLEGRQYVMEQIVDKTTSPKIAESVLARGPRNVQSFVAAEEARALDIAKSKILQ